MNKALNLLRQNGRRVTKFYYGSKTNLTLGCTRKFIPPPWYKRGGGEGLVEPLPGVFDMLQYFETILPLVESL